MTAAPAAPVTLPTRWAPNPGPQTTFLADTSDEAGYGGAKAGGKTDALIALPSRWFDRPTYHAAFFRRSYKDLAEVMLRMHALYPLLGGEWHGTDKKWTFPSGAILSLHHFSDDRAIAAHHGQQYQTILIDQLEAFEEAHYTTLMGMLRGMDPTIPKRMRSSFNPGGIGHEWVKKRFVDLGPYNRVIDLTSGLSRIFIPALITDNPALLQADPDYIKRLLANSDKALVDAYLYGRWDSFAGAFFTWFSDAIHVAKSAHLPPEWHEVSGGIDWGFTSDPGVVLWSSFDELGRATVYRELTFENETATEVADKIMARCVTEKERTMTFICDTQLWDKSRQSGGGVGVSVADEMQRRFAERGFTIGLVRANKDRLNGWQRVQSYLNPRRVGPDGERGWIKFMPFDPETGLGCARLIETIPYQLHHGRIKGDVKASSNDHWMDALRYMLMAQEPITTPPQSIMHLSTEQLVHHRNQQELLAAIQRQESARPQRQPALEVAAGFGVTMPNEDNEYEGWGTADIYN